MCHGKNLLAPPKLYKIFKRTNLNINILFYGKNVNIIFSEVYLSEFTLTVYNSFTKNCWKVLKVKKIATYSLFDNMLSYISYNAIKNRYYTISMLFKLKYRGK